MTATVRLDLPKVRANVEAFHAEIEVGVRAHVKAHRTVELGVFLVRAGAIGLAVHSGAEALAYAEHGVDDIVVAWPWQDEWRWPVFARAAAATRRFVVHVDSETAIAALGAAARDAGSSIGVRIDLRSAADSDVLALAKAAATTDGVYLDGVTGYTGPETADELARCDELGATLAARLAAAASRIRAAGFDCPEVCAGGTSTARGALSVGGLTEVCSGVYPMYDAGSVTAGLCTPDQVAVTVEGDGAPELLAGTGQYWSPEETSVRRESDGSLLPAHICPLVRRIDAFELYDGTGPAGHWEVRVRPDPR